MLFLVSSACNDILPILRLLRKGVIPLIQIVIIAALVILLIIDLILFLSTNSISLS